MKYEVHNLLSDTTDHDGSDFFVDVRDSLSGISDSKIEGFFNSKAIGSKSKSLASTIRSLITADLQLKGWVGDWAPFGQGTIYSSAVWNFDVAKRVIFEGKAAWVTVEISFDNRVAIGTNLVKAQVANNMSFRDSGTEAPIVHHCIITGTKDFKTYSGIDGSVATSEEYLLASKPYGSLNLVPTTLIGLERLETLEVTQRKFDGRTRSRLINLDANQS